MKIHKPKTKQKKTIIHLFSDQFRKFTISFGEKYSNINRIISTGKSLNSVMINL